MDYSVTALLASIRRRGFFENSTATGTADADLLALANEELQSSLVPFIMNLHEEYFLWQYTVTMTAGTAAYRIPSRAMGAKLREVDVVTTGSEVRNLVRISADELEEWPQGSNGTPTAFYVRGNNVVLVPAPAQAETLRLTYFIRPNELKVSTTTGLQAITAIDTGNGRVTVSSTTGITTSTLVDFHKGTSGFEHLSIDQTPSVVGTPSGTVTVTLPTGLAVGDYIVLAEQSLVPQVPADFHPLLSQRVVCKLLEARGFFQKLGPAQAQLREMEEILRRAYAPRVDGEPVILASNSYGLLPGWVVPNA